MNSRARRKETLECPVPAPSQRLDLFFYFEMFYSLLLSHNHLCIRILFMHVKEILGNCYI